MQPGQKGFKKGEGGRKKGAKNKLTNTVKSVFEEVFHDLQSDPKAKLSAWAKTNTTEFYKLAARIMPTEIEGDISITAIKVVREP